LKTIRSIKFDTFLKYSIHSYLVWSFIRFSLTFSAKNAFWIVPQISPLTSLVEPFFILIFTAGTVIILLKGVRINWVSAILITLVLLSYIVSFFISIDSIINSIKFFAGYYKFIPLFIISAYLYKKSLLKAYSVLKIILVLLILQVFVNLLWFFDLQLLKNTRALIPGNPDWAYGTMENTHMLAATFVIIFVLGIYFLNEKSKKYKILGVGLIIIGIIQVAWAESKINFLTISFSLFVLSLLKPGVSFSIKRIGLILGILFSFVMVGSLIYTDLSHYAVSSQGVWATIGYYWDVFVKTLDYNYKIQFIKYLVFEYPRNLHQFLFGAGPGTLASNFALENPTTLSQEHFIPLMNKNFNSGNSVLLNPHTGYTAILGDLGWFGFFSYFGFHFYLLYKISLKYWKNRFYSEVEIVAATIWIGLMINYLLNNFFKDSLYIGAPVVILWILAGILMHTEGIPKKKFKLVKTNK